MRDTTEVDNETNRSINAVYHGDVLSDGTGREYEVIIDRAGHAMLRMVNDRGGIDWTDV